MYFYSSSTEKKGDLLKHSENQVPYSHTEWVYSKGNFNLARPVVYASLACVEKKDSSRR